MRNRISPRMVALCSETASNLSVDKGAPPGKHTWNGPAAFKLHPPLWNGTMQPAEHRDPREFLGFSLHFPCKVQFWRNTFERRTPIKTWASARFLTFQKQHAVVFWSNPKPPPKWRRARRARSYRINLVASANDSNFPPGRPRAPGWNCYRAVAYATGMLSVRCRPPPQHRMSYLSCLRFGPRIGLMPMEKVWCSF